MYTRDENAIKYYFFKSQWYIKVHSTLDPRSYNSNPVLIIVFIPYIPINE